MIDEGASIVMSGLQEQICSIRVYSGGAPQRVLTDLLPAYERATGQAVVATFEIVSRIQDRLAAGERPDLILLPEQLLVEIATTVPLREEGREVLARVGIGAIVKEGANPPDFSDEAGVRSTLQRAKAIAVADARTPTGRHLDGLLERLGLIDSLRDRLIRKAAIHGGGELVASGEAEIGLYLASEVQHISGVRVAAYLPPSLQQHVVYGAAIPVSERSFAQALSLVQFLKLPEHAVLWREAGFEPAGAA